MSPTIRTALIVSVLVLGLYEVTLRILSPQISEGRDQPATNTITLERYADRPQAMGTVLVGSSVSARLPANQLPADWYNLSLSGGSALTGLQLVSEDAPYPKRVLIETNVLDKDADDDALSTIENPVRREARHLFRFLRAANDPINVVRWMSLRTRGAPPADEPTSEFPTLLEVQKRSYANPLSAHFAVTLGTIRSLVARLQQHGVTVGFYEMPVDRHLVSLPRAVQMRTQLAEAFPHSRYCWVTVDDGHNWQTTDGLHLASKETDAAAQFLAAGTCLRP